MAEELRLRNSMVVFPCENWRCE